MMALLNLQVHSYWLSSPQAARKVLLVSVVSKDPTMPTSWKIVESAYTLSKVGEWVLEPSPSNRTPQYIENNHYSSIEEALAVWERYRNDFEN